jgi:mRNA-degrading endonuclease toxin of MazEF toxin-antitoxin module
MKRGDVILCHFPHTGTVPAKIRPALVVQNNYYNQRIANLLVAAITSNLVNVSDPSHYLIDISVPAGMQSGLNRNSLVSCINLAVIPPRNVERKIGELPEAEMKQIDRCLKMALALS